MRRRELSIIILVTAMAICSLTPVPALALADELYNLVRDLLAPAKRYAVAIGINQYQKKIDLNYAVNDAKTIAGVLMHLGYIVDPDAILVQSPDRPDVTKSDIIRQVRRVLKMAGPRDTVIVFYAGHGAEISLRDGKKEAYLLPSNFDPELPIETGLSFGDLVRLAALEDVEAKHILFILDACYGGAALKAYGLRDDPNETNESFIRDLLSNEAFMVLTAGGDGQIVKEKDGHGVFTQELVRGLSGAADSNADGVMHFNELVTWIEPRVFEAAMPLKQNVGAGRLFDSLGQPVFVVPTASERNTMLGEVEGSTITQEMKARCRRVGNICPWLGGTRGDEEQEPALEPKSNLSSFDPRQLDLAFWESVRDSGNPDDFQAYLDTFSTGIFVPLAENRLRKLRTEQTVLVSPPALPESDRVIPPAPYKGPAFTLKLQSTATPQLLHHDFVLSFAGLLAEASNGRAKLDILPAGAVVKSYQVVDATAKQVLDAGWSTPVYLYGREPAFALLSGPPFGPNPRDLMDWYSQGGGAERLNDLYQKLGLDVHSLPCAIFGPEGDLWTNREIRNADDLEGLKARWVGMQAQVATATGMKVTQLPGGEIVPAVERGVIDSTNWAGPSEDRAFGMQELFSYYYFPGVMTPTTVYDLVINKKRWDALTSEAKLLLEEACASNISYTITEYKRRSGYSLTYLLSEGVQIRSWPPSVLAKFRGAWESWVSKYGRETEFRRIYDSMAPYRR